MISKPSWDEVLYSWTRYLSFAWIIGLLSVFLFYPPYWALMDDWGHINSAAQRFSGKNIFQYISGFIQGDFSWGMFRPVYPAFIYSFYGAFWKSSQLAYLFLLALNLTLFWAWAVLFERTIRVFAPKLEKSRTKIFKWFFLIFCFLFSPNYTLLFFASLQERLILIFAAIAYHGMLRLAENKSTQFSAACFLIGGLLLCVLSKASAIFLIPPFALWLAVLFLETRNAKFAWLACLIFFVGIGSAYGFHLIRAGYTSDYLVSAMWDHWVRFGGRLHKPLITCLIAAILSVFCWKKTNPSNSWSRLYALLFWPLTMLCFALVMLPWRSVVNYYLIVPGGMFLTGSKLIICFLIWLALSSKNQKWLIALLLVICTITSIPCARKVWKTARQHHGTGETVEFLKAELQKGNLEGVTIRMPQPCIEASVAMSLFLDRPGFIQVLSQNDIFPREKGGPAKRVLMINGECSEIPKNFSISKEMFSYHPWHLYQSTD